MLRGEFVGLRARIESDVPILHSELYENVATRSRADSRPWRPIPSGPFSPYALAEPSPTEAIFSVVELGSHSLAGEAVLWQIDTHNRFAHLGMSLIPQFRGRGLAAEVVALLCQYGFRTRGLSRLQLETLADNDAMRRTAERAGFTLEATLRRSAWVEGQFLDEVIYGLLDSEWRSG